MIRIQRRGSIDSGSPRLRRFSDRRRSVVLAPLLEGLEDRTMLSTITWNNAVAPSGGDWDTGNNWVGGNVPSSSDDAIINLTSTGTVTVSSNLADAVDSVTTNAETSLKVENGSLSLGAGSSTLGSPAERQHSRAMLILGAGASVVVEGGQTITDDGTMTIETGSAVELITNNQATTQITVNGVLNANNANFSYTSSNSGNALIQVNPGGFINPTGCTFNLTLGVPYNDVPSLAGNVSFDQIAIASGTLSTGTLELGPIGTNTSNLSYAFPSGFSILSGAALSIGPDVNVLIEGGQTITDNGTMTIETGSAVELITVNQATTQIAVNGVLNANSANFSYTSSNSGNALIQVNPGGFINPTGCTVPA